MPPNEKCVCEICGGEYNKSYLSRHLASKKHLKATGGTQETSDAVKKDGELHLEESDENDSDNATFYLSETASMTGFGSDDDEFLNDLAGDKWIDPEETELKMKEERKKESEMKKMRQQEIKDIQNQAKMEQARKKLDKAQKKEPEDAVFTENEIELLGFERLSLIKKITQYKSQFPKELSKIRVPKKNPSVEVLQRILDEIDALLDLGSIDTFVLDGVFQSLKVVEGISSLTTRFNITGLADCLKRDPTFISLAKRLLVKYGSFAQCSPESQMVFLVCVSAYMISQKNSQAAKFNAFLNEPLPIPPQTS